MAGLFAITNDHNSQIWWGKFWFQEDVSQVIIQEEIFKPDAIICFFMITAKDLKRVCLVCIYPGKGIGEFA